MTECIICGHNQDIRMSLITKKPICRYCCTSEYIPNNIYYIAIMADPDEIYSCDHSTFDITNWMFHPSIVKRRAEIGMPLMVEILTERPYNCELRLGKITKVTTTETRSNCVILENRWALPLEDLNKHFRIYDHNNKHNMGTDKYPHICPYCKSPAWLGGMYNLECSKNCRQ